MNECVNHKSYTLERRFCIWSHSAMESGGRVGKASTQAAWCVNLLLCQPMCKMPVCVFTATKGNKPSLWGQIMRLPAHSTTTSPMIRGRGGYFLQPHPPPPTCLF